MAANLRALGHLGYHWHRLGQPATEPRARPAASSCHCSAGSSLQATAMLTSPSPELSRIG
jgi:hypothetical protein